MTPPFRAEHVGSLLRPAKLKRAFPAVSRRRIRNEDYEAVLGHAIRHAVRLQEEVGPHSIPDGEFGRKSKALGITIPQSVLVRADEVIR